MRHLAILVFMALPACTSCEPNPINPPPPFSDAAPPPAMLPPATVYGELVEAGCLMPDDSGDGLTNVVLDELSDAEPSWLACLFSGGTTKSCAAPCP